MANRVVAVGIDVDKINNLGASPWETPSRGAYVGGPYAEGPWLSLLWKDLRLLEKRSRMTEIQAAVFEAHIFGVSNARIAEARDISESTVSRHLCTALCKAEKNIEKGMLTVIYEGGGGWRAVGILLSG